MQSPWIEFWQSWCEISTPLWLVPFGRQEHVRYLKRPLNYHELHHPLTCRAENEGSGARIQLLVN